MPLDADAIREAFEAALAAVTEAGATSKDSAGWLTLISTHVGCSLAVRLFDDTSIGKNRFVAYRHNRGTTRTALTHKLLEHCVPADNRCKNEQMLDFVAGIKAHGVPSVPFVVSMESEASLTSAKNRLWTNHSDARWDFFKLLAVPSLNRIMVIQTSEDLTKKLQEGASQHHSGSPLVGTIAIVEVSPDKAGGWVTFGTVDGDAIDWPIERKEFKRPDPPKEYSLQAE